MSSPTSPFKKVLLSAGVIGLYGLYALRQSVVSNQPSTNLSLLTSPSSLPISTAVPTINIPTTLPPTLLVRPTNQPTSLPATPVPTATPSGQYRDGQYTGTVADAFYGPMQVKAIIQGGKLADVQFLQYPNDRGRSVEINNYALPQLRTEAITAQSAQVDGVSGASASSGAFVQSLGSALQQAHV